MSSIYIYNIIRITTMINIITIRVFNHGKSRMYMSFNILFMRHINTILFAISNPIHQIIHIAFLPLHHI